MAPQKVCRFPDETFEKVLRSHALRARPDAHAELRKISHVLKQSGKHHARLKSGQPKQGVRPRPVLVAASVSA
jgi:ubiquinone/menaquinone biosynthesis C-methylase UbiE